MACQGVRVQTEVPRQGWGQEGKGRETPLGAWGVGWVAGLDWARTALCLSSTFFSSLALVTTVPLCLPNRVRNLRLPNRIMLMIPPREGQHHDGWALGVLLTAVFPVPSPVQLLGACL